MDIDPAFLESLHNFRLSKRSSKGAAIIGKIDKKKLLLEEEDLLDPTTPDELAEELPEHSPRFVILSYELHHSDGRVSYVCIPSYHTSPSFSSSMCLCFGEIDHSWAPASASMELSTLYASALSGLSAQADVGKVIEIRDGELSRTVLDERLGARR